MILGDSRTEAVGFSKLKSIAYDMAANARAYDYDEDWTVKVEYNPLVESTTESYKA